MADLVVCRSVAAKERRKREREGERFEAKVAESKRDFEAKVAKSSSSTYPSKTWIALHKSFRKCRLSLELMKTWRIDKTCRKL
jgi:hypothetical protein